MALVCPICRAGFRAGFTHCTACKAALVDDSTLPAADADPRDTLRGKKRVTIVQAGLAACKEMQRALDAAHIPCVVEAIDEEGQPLATGAMKVGVVVAEEDVPRVAALLQKQFAALLSKEGVGSMQSAAIDPTAASVTCPACGHVGALVDNCCADCGLFLGVGA
jgi:hypothetical protein